MQLNAPPYTENEVVLEEALEIEIIDNDADNNDNSKKNNNETEYVYNSAETEEDQKLQEEKEKIGRESNLRKRCFTNYPL